MTGRAAAPLRHSIFGNVASQLYLALLGVVMVPVYVRYMGIEAFGLVGFYAMLLAWFQVLDLGLSPTMAREAARFRGAAISGRDLRNLLRALEGIFAGTAIFGALFIGGLASTIATNWLQVQLLSVDEVRNAILLIAAIVALRLVSGLYRGAITGLEHLVWLSGFNALIATVRFALVVPFLAYVDASPTSFFWYQLAVAAAELVMLATKTYSLFPRIKTGEKTVWQWRSMRDVLTFSLTIAFTSSVWVAVTHSDKLVLSKLLSLSNFAYFSIAVVVASAVTLISNPIGGALLPRLTKLAAEKNDIELIHIYRGATQLVGVLVAPISLVLTFFPESVLWVWTGNAAIVENAAPVLSLYALGNGILAFAAFPYYLQFAKGDLKLHLIGSCFFVAALVPILVWATFLHGVTGAACAWVGANALYFIAWIPLVHGRLAKNLHFDWLLIDVAAIVAPPLGMAMVIKWGVGWPDGRIQQALCLSAVFFCLLMIAAGSSARARRMLREGWAAQLPGR